MSRTTLILTVLATALSAGPAGAGGIGEAPLPPLMGQPSKHVWSVPGALSTSYLASVFACTNASTNAVRVGVEVFGTMGVQLNDPSPTSILVVSGATVLFATSPVAALGIDADLASGTFGQGSARILASARRGIICSAYVIRPTGSPGYLDELPVVARLKQRGD